MQRFVLELKKLMSFKDTTEVGDIVLIAAKEPQMLLYAKIIGIERDPSRKDEWWHVKMAVLSIPIQNMVWTLRTPQMTGMEIFTMGGEERFVKAIDFQDEIVEPPEEKKSVSKSSGKISSLRRVK